MIKKISDSRYLYALLALPIIYFLIFEYGPMIGVLIAFKNYNAIKGIWASDWVGLKYFNQFLFDPYFWKLVRNTIILNIYMIIFYFPLPIILALMLNEVRRHVFKRFVQTISYLPYFLSTVVICGMLVNFLTTKGMVNQLIVFFGGQPINFLLEADWFRTIYVASEIWQNVGWGSIIYLAALTGVEPDQYEAAKIDGANRWKQMIHVTLPGIAPVITIMFLLNLGNILKIGFEKILLLYTGPTYETADVISTYVFRRGLINADFSYASAVGLFQSVIILLFITLANYTARKVSETSLW